MRSLLTVVAAMATGLFLTVLAVTVHPPRRRLAGRVRPYAAASLSALGRPVVHAPVAMAGAPGRGTLGRVVDLLHGGSDDPVLRLRLQRAGVYGVPDALLVNEHRVRQVLAGLGGAGVGLVMGVPLDLSGAAVLGLTALGATAGALRPTAAVDKAIERRRRRLRAEIPAVCQVLALRLRAHGSVVSAVGQTLERTHGLLAEELAEAFAQHRAGRLLDEALDALAAATPEPEAARVHRLLAGAIRHGLDAAPELLRVARGTREAHLTRLRREATRRRAAILLPTIGLLAPLMLLFIAAPLPSLVLGS